MSSGNKQTFLYGLFFSTLCVLFWSMLPIALKISGGFSDPITLTWIRFTVAGLVVLTWQANRGLLKEFLTLTRRQWLILCAAGSCLIVNYTFYAWSLDFLHPGTAQLSFQVAPIFLALGGLVFFKERVRWQQWGCFGVLAVGMLMFFHPVLEGSVSGDPRLIATGFLIIQASAFAWCLYALLQKSLSNALSSSNILLAIYLYALVVMLPFSQPSELRQMNTSQTLIVVFCCINTLIAYGSFAKAMNYWQTVQVSAAIALTPVVAFSLAELCVSLGLWQNQIQSAHADTLSLTGMMVVVSAAISVQFITASLNRRQRKLQNTKTSTA